MTQKRNKRYESHPAEDEHHTAGVSHSSGIRLKVIQRSEKETEERNQEKHPQKESVAASPHSPSGSPVVFEEGREEEQEAHPDLMTLRVEYTTLSHQLAQLDANKQAGQWARLYRQVRAAEARLRQAKQNTLLSQTSPPEIAKHQSEFAKQKETTASREETALPAAETATADERQAQLHAIASDLLYWKGGLKVLRQAQLRKLR